MKQIQQSWLRKKHTKDTSETNRTLLVGPLFCCKTFLLLVILQIILLDNPEQQMKI